MKRETVFKMAIILILGSFILGAERALATPPITPPGQDEPDVVESPPSDVTVWLVSDADAEGGAGGRGGSSFSDSEATGGSARIGNSNTTNSSVSYNYEEAAKTAAALTTAVCQDGTSLQGVKFGLSKVNQSIFCMYTVTAQLSLGISASMVCEDGPDYRQCMVNKNALFLQGAAQLGKAIKLADKKAHRGLLKRLFRKVW